MVYRIPILTRPLVRNIPARKQSRLEIANLRLHIYKRQPVETRNSQLEKPARDMADFKVFNHPRPKKSVLPPLPKKRKTEHKIEEINFDFDKREDYLTGFHKRKVARVKQAQAEAEKKAREERTELRKTVCWMLASPLFLRLQIRQNAGFVKWLC